VTCYFSWHQRETSRGQLRLNLYDRRYKLYDSIFDFYNAMISWQGEGTPEQQEAFTRFFRASKESIFLFTTESGIPFVGKRTVPLRGWRGSCANRRSSSPTAPRGSN